MVALVRCLQLDPVVLLLDEPTASLDRAAAEAAEALLDQWQSDERYERSYIWVSHDHEQATRMSSRTVQIHEGRIHAEA
jgi:putative ABC transport system ATP-binding protein